MQLGNHLCFARLLDARRALCAREFSFCTPHSSCITLSMNLAWFRWVWGVLLLVGTGGCVQHVISPPPDFTAPVVKPASVVSLPDLAPERTSTAPSPAARLPQAVRGTVVIDAGHGGKDPGSQAYRKVDEKTINLAVARLVAKKLSARGVKVVMTRNSDVFIELADRAAAGRHADLFVSIHADSNPDPSKRGHTVIYPRGADSRSVQLGRFIDHHLTAAGSPRYSLRADNRGLLVLRKAECPAVLVELGYLTNRTEAALLASPEYQEKLATGVANGIIAYLASMR